jgi:hypothetical protein
MDFFAVPDGLEEIRNEMPKIVEIIVRTARWVHPDTFHALPVWYPETARKLPLYDAKWGTVYKNTNKLTALVSDKVEPNIKAGKAFIAALGARKTDNWTVCHIGGSMILGFSEITAWCVIEDTIPAQLTWYGCRRL